MGVKWVREEVRDDAIDEAGQERVCGGGAGLVGGGNTVGMSGGGGGG